MKRNMSEKKRPSEPTKKDQSHFVGVYMSHDDGRKSRWRLVTMMTKRSSHMPMFTMIEMTEEPEDRVADPLQPQELRRE